MRSIDPFPLLRGGRRRHLVPARLSSQAVPRVELGAIQKVNVFAFNPPSIRGLGRTGGFDFLVEAGKTRATGRRR